MSLEILGTGEGGQTAEAAEPLPHLHIAGCRLIDGTGAAAKPSCSIWIEEGRIAALGEEADARAAQAPHQRLEGSGLCAVPGLVDGHVHLIFDGGPAPGGVTAYVADRLCLSDANLVVQAVASAQTNLVRGVTTVRDCGDRHNCVLPVRDAIASGVLPGPRIVACGMPITTTAGHCHYLGLTADSVDEVRKAVRAQVQAGVDALKLMLTGGGMTPGSNPTRLQYDLAEARAAVEEAHRLGRRVAAHIHAAEGMEAAVAAGIDTLEHSNWLTPDGARYDPAVAGEMAAAGLMASFTFPNQDHVLLRPRDEYTSEMERLRASREQRYEWIRAMIAAGVPYMVTTDAGATGTRHGSLARAAQVFVELVGMEPLKAIAAITRSPAEALGLGDQVGTVEVGKQADLVLVRGDPSQQIEALQEVEWVVQGGRLVVEQGRLLW